VTYWSEFGEQVSDVSAALGTSDILGRTAVLSIIKPWIFSSLHCPDNKTIVASRFALGMHLTIYLLVSTAEQNLDEISDVILVVFATWNAHDTPQGQYMNTWRHTRNRKYITYHNAARSGRGHGHRQHEQKIGKVGPSGFRVMRADRQTHILIIRILCTRLLWSAGVFFQFCKQQHSKNMAWSRIYLRILQLHFLPSPELTTDVALQSRPKFFGTACIWHRASWRVVFS